MSYTNIEVKRVKDHYEVYADGKFVCSGDTIKDVGEDLRALMFGKDEEPEQKETLLGKKLTMPESSDST